MHLLTAMYSKDAIIALTVTTLDNDNEVKRNNVSSPCDSPPLHYKKTNIL